MHRLISSSVALLLCLTSCTQVAETGATPIPSKSTIPASSENAASYFVPLTGFQYVDAGEGADKGTRQILIDPAVKGVLTDTQTRRITFQGDDYGVTVTVYVVDALVATKPGLQDDLVNVVSRLSGMKSPYTFALAGRSVSAYAVGSAISYAWLQRNYFVVVTSAEEAKVERISIALVNANTADARFLLGGQVISQDTGAPIPNVAVNIVSAGPVCCDGNIPIVYTGATGRFSVTVPAGTYRVLFYPAGIDGYGPAWWKGATDFESATDVVLSASNVYLPDAVLPAGRGVSGTIADAAGRGVTGAHVDAFAANGGGFVAEGTTVAGGRFILRLPFGKYRLLFWASGDMKLEPRWWPDAKKIDQSELITIGADGPPIDGRLGGDATQ